MKTAVKKILTLLVLLALLLTSAAFAQTEDDFILGCSTKTVAEAELFSAGTDESGKKTVYTAVGLLPQGVYVQCTGREDDDAGYAECRYFADGAEQLAWVKKDVLGPAWKLVYFEGGGYVKLHDTIADDPQALSDYCSRYFPGRAYDFEVAISLPPVPPDAMLAADWASVVLGEVREEPVGVQLHTLGLINSEVEAEGQSLTVPTAMLTFAQADEGEQQVAAVFAPRTGEASLREEASGSSTTVETCKSGRIVIVLEYSEGTYTRILYEGKEGYIRTDCLIFPEVTEEDAYSGMLIVNKKTDGKDLVTIRANNAGSAARIGTWPTGTVVTVYGEKNGWYEVEVDGWFGYVQKKYLKRVENGTEE